MARQNFPIALSSVLPVMGSLLSGVLLALSFPGVGQTSLAFVGLVPLMYAVQSAPPKRAAWLGLLSGLVFFLISLSWLQTLPAKVDGLGLKASALLGYATLALYCALYFVPMAVVVAAGVQRWGTRSWRINLRLMFAATMVWVASEYLRSFLFTGFPWNALGVSQYSNLAIIQIAEWGGVYIVSAALVWMNAAVFITLRQYTHGTRTKQYRPHVELMLGLLPIALAAAHGMSTLLNRPPLRQSMRVVLVQPNIPQSAKWDDQKDQEILNRLEELTSAALQLEDIDLVIWPETALPGFVHFDRSSYLLVKRMAALGAPLLVGSMDVVFSGAGRTYYNSSILFDTNGVEVAKYNKQHLVPFGEYVPFPGLMRKFTPLDIDFGGGRESTLFRLRGQAAFSTLICFEDIVAPLSVKAVRNNARWLVNQTNDGWFDPSSQSEQHVAHAVFRCIENRVPMARCCNTGITCTIDAFGAVQRKLAPRIQGFTTTEIHPRPLGLKKTFYTRNGDAFAKGSLLAAATVIFALRSSRWKKKGKPAEPTI